MRSRFDIHITTIKRINTVSKIVTEFMFTQMARPLVDMKVINPFGGGSVKFKNIVFKNIKNVSVRIYRGVQ